jgi:16S rRNA (cytidine1402-2'-O)-methyltransferase
MLGTLFVVATPIGNLEDLSARALRILKECAVIAAEDTRRTGQLLARYGITTPTTSLHEHNERAKSPGLVARLRAGESVALVSDAGTPTVSDPGGQLIAAAIAAGIRIEPVPGASALLALLAVSGLPTERFAFMGFPPLKANDRVRWLQAIASFGHTAVFFEAPQRIQRTLEQLRDYFGDCHIVVGREMTKINESILRGPISEVHRLLADAKGEICVGIDAATALATATMGARPTDVEVASMFREITKNGGVSRRRAINLVAQRLAMTPNEVYESVERGKISVE